MDPRIAEIEEEYRRDDLPAFDAGDTVRVRVRVREGEKERIQAFEGICISKRGSGVNATFTVRKVSGGVGVERIFPLHSPSLAGIEVVRRGSVRRAKLYYLRERRGKKARVREKAWWLDAVQQEEAPSTDEEGGADAADDADVAGAAEADDAATAEHETPAAGEVADAEPAETEGRA